MYEKKEEKRIDRLKNKSTVTGLPLCNHHIIILALFPKFHV